MKVHAMFKGNIWVADIAYMGSLSSYNCGVENLSCVIDVFTKYAWVKPLKNKKPKTIVHGFIEILN